MRVQIEGSWINMNIMPLLWVFIHGGYLFRSWREICFLYVILLYSSSSFFFSTGIHKSHSFTAFAVEFSICGNFYVSIVFESRGYNKL